MPAPIDEEQNAPFRLFHLFEDCLQTFLELAAVLGARNERAHIEREERLVLEPFGDVPLDDTLSEPFGDRRLADARLADEHGVIFGLAREDADDVPDLLVPADDGFELVLAGELCQIGAVLFEGFVGIFGVVALDVLIAAHLLHALQKALFGEPEALEKVQKTALAAVKEAQKEMFDGDVVVLHALREAFRLIQKTGKGCGGIHLPRTAARNAREPPDLFMQSAGKPVRIAVCAAQDAIAHAVLFEERVGKVGAGELGIAVLRRSILRVLHRFQRFFRVFICVHIASLLIRVG